MTAPARNDDTPIPYVLTAKARAALAAGPAAPSPADYCGCGYDDCSACAGYGWACRACGAAYFGTSPEHGHCPRCAPARLSGTVRPPAAPLLPQSAPGRPGPPADRSRPSNTGSKEIA
jgi:hypothetical protein